MPITDNTVPLIAKHGLRYESSQSSETKKFERKSFDGLLVASPQGRGVSPDDPWTANGGTCVPRGLAHFEVLKYIKLLRSGTASTLLVDGLQQAS